MKKDAQLNLTLNKVIKEGTKVPSYFIFYFYKYN